MKTLDTRTLLVLSVGLALILATSIVLLTQGSAANSPAVATYEILHSFTGNDNHGFTGDTDGANPYAPLIQAPDGTFYGTTATGSASAGAGNGTVFKMDATGKITVLHHFVATAGGDGANPYGGVTLAKDGNLYGTTYSAVGVTGSGQNGGVIYKLNTSGSYTKLWTFTGIEGGLPKAGLIQAKDGNLYGTSIKGGYLAGAVYRLAPGGTPTLLHGFKAPDGLQPTCNLLQATDGNLYGTTYAGGTSGLGTVFKLSTSGGFTVIHTFKGPDGGNPISGLIQTADGSLYGTAATGGQYGQGAIFKIDPTGTYSVIFSFNGTDGAKPFGNLLQANDGNLYGTTYGGGHAYGTIFKITLAGAFTLLHSFGDVTRDGGLAAAGLIQGLDGKLYGTTYIGGAQNKGVVFRLDLGLRPITPPIPSPSPSSTPTSSPTPGPGPSPQPSPSPGPACSNNSCGEAHGDGRLETRTDGTSFNFHVKSNSRSVAPNGKVEFFDRETRKRFRSTSISCLVISGDHATISGVGEVDRSPVTFKVEVDEKPKYQGGAFSIVLSNGYQRSGVPHNSKVELRSCRSAHAHAEVIRVSPFPQTPQITYANWQSHPMIVAIRKIVNSVNISLKRGSYKTSMREFESCGESYFTRKRIARTAKGLAAWYQDYSEYEDSSYNFDYYYDEQGRLRFVFANARAGNGTRDQHRIYFDETGNRIWEANELVKGPGCPGCFQDPYPASELALDPSQAFASLKGCVEKKPRK